MYAARRYIAYKALHTAGLNPLFEPLSFRIKKIIIQEWGKDCTLGTFISAVQSHQFHKIPLIGAKSIAEAELFIRNLSL